MASPVKEKRVRYALLSWTRLAAAVGVLLLFLRAFTSSLQQWSGTREVLMGLQLTGGLTDGGLLSPMIVAFLIGAILFGRWYCSVLCPFGTLQEAVWRAGRLVAGKGRYVSPWRVRYLVSVLAGAGLLLSVPSLFAAMDPIANFGRGIRSAQALVVEGAVAITPWIVAVLGMFAFVLALGAARGRRFCDWCPVGILLGACASVAPFGMRLQKDACVSCGNCERACPMNCIDAKNKTLDPDRCILCLSCAGKCPTGALDYGTPRSAEPAAHEGRRAFLRRGGRVLGALAGATYLGGATLRALQETAAPLSGAPLSGADAACIDRVLPPGAQSVEHFLSRCIGCRACVSACPAGIIRADEGLQPKLDYLRGYCQINCTECIQTCPTHALRPLNGGKQRTRIGMSELDRTRCVAVVLGESCGACAEVCPTHALRMEPITPGSSLTAPVFDPEYCIGCGGCFNVCPAEPRAFVVRGVSPQTSTLGIRPVDAVKGTAPSAVFTSADEFPF